MCCYPFNVHNEISHIHCYMVFIYLVMWYLLNTTIKQVIYHFQKCTDQTWLAKWYIVIIKSCKTVKFVHSKIAVSPLPDSNPVGSFEKIASDLGSGGGFRRALKFHPTFTLHLLQHTTMAEKVTINDIAKFGMTALIGTTRREYIKYDLHPNFPHLHKKSYELWWMGCIPG